MHDFKPGRLAAGGAPRKRLRVLVVDDHEVVHWGFRLMLGEQPWVERCLSARNGEEALSLARRYEPHVALVDLFVGEESGAEICERVRFILPDPNVLLISGAAGSHPTRPRRRAPPASSPRTGRPPTSPAPCAWSGSA